MPRPGRDILGDKVGQKFFLKDTYKLYLKLCDEPSPIEVYKKVVQGFLKFIVDKAIEGKEVKLPAGMGSIKILGRKPRVRLEGDKIVGAPVDWGATREMWKKFPEKRETKELIYHMNEHTDGVNYSLKWSKKDVMVTNKTIYTLRFTRTNKRTTGREILDNNKEYIVAPQRLRRNKS